MEYPLYKKLETMDFFVKIIDEENNLHIRKNDSNWHIDFNGSANESYSEMKGCSRNEFDEHFKLIVEELNQITKL